MAHKKRVVILGGGYGGIHAAQTLDRLLGRDEAEITLIDKNDHHTLLTELHEVAGARVNEDSVRIPFSDIFRRSKVRVVKDTVTGIDLNKKVLRSETAEYPYDYLVLACGSEPEFYGIPGMAENAFTLWSLEDARKIKAQVRAMFELAVAERDPIKRQELLTFVVGGGGFTGVEMAGELAEWVPELCREFGLSPFSVTVYVIEALPRILPTLADNLAARAARAMRAKGITVLTDSPIVEVGRDEITLKSGTKIRTRTVIWTGGVRTTSFLRDKGFDCKKRGRLTVNEYLQVVGHDDVYAVGDNCFFADENGELPALVESALQGGACAARNIAADIKGTPKRRFRPRLHGVMVSVGSHYSVADLMGMSLWSYPATAMKHLVNLHYQWGVGGMRVILKYLRHEMINARGVLSELMKHANVKVSLAWLVILRVFLGYEWLVSGLGKIRDGFLVSGDKLVSGSSLMPMGPGTPEWYRWLMDTFVFPHALFFQWVVTLTELALGLALIFGLFTSIAALGSIFMNVNFALAGAGGNIWFVMVSIAMLGGAGRAFGLDYYVMPILGEVIRGMLPKGRLASGSRTPQAGAAR
ncbi:MAG: FAD-dependent oxidoreductase [Firmicutes bacterium]|jgi:NADH dehydrogenase|nr:FAD-dependent oxidoreductase [Bacillota bacterium]MDH7494474.1 FAD-dependent oxidoreductase [Bacillota bacterium]